MIFGLFIFVNQVLSFIVTTIQYNNNFPISHANKILHAKDTYKIIDHRKIEIYTQNLTGYF